MIKPIIAAEIFPSLGLLIFDKAQSELSGVNSKDPIKGIILDIGPHTIEMYKNIINENPESIIIGNGLSYNHK